MRRWPDTAALFVAVAAVAFLAPPPWFNTDRHMYERVAGEIVIPYCSDLHCFRPLVPWLLGLVPGPAILAWKLYAVVFQVAAGLAMAAWARRAGASGSAVPQVAWLTALGAGACQTLFDPFTADPVMHLLGPVLMLLIDRQQVGDATRIAAVGVLAKEFAAVPLLTGAIAALLRRQWRSGARLVFGFACVVMVWGMWQFVARYVLGYSFGNSHSAELASGAYLTFWLRQLSPLLVVFALLMVFGGVWLLWAVGLFWGSSNLRLLTVATIPALVVFDIVQQPDRALWNFAFLAMPAAAMVLSRVPPAMGWTFVALQVLMNVRFAGQLTFLPSSRLLLACALVGAAATIAVAWRNAVSSAQPSAAVRA